MNRERMREIDPAERAPPRQFLIKRGGREGISPAGREVREKPLMSFFWRVHALEEEETRRGLSNPG